MFRRRSSGGSSVEVELGVWMAEYREMCSLISARIDLAQRNANLLFVVTLGAGGYLVTMALRQGMRETLQSEVAIILPLGLLISLGFAIRHIDHEANMIDASRYIEEVIRPNVVRLAGGGGLEWENYLRLARRQRIRRYFGTSVLGGELAMIFLLAAPLLVVCWLVVAKCSGYSGSLDALYLTLSTLGSVGLLWVGSAVWFEWRGFESITEVRRRG